MELLPVLEPEDEPREGVWYALIPRGGGPGVSVGHTCTYIPSSDDGKGKILIVGGANPNGSFSDCHVIDLDRHEWDAPEWDGLSARYEHCSFVPASSPRSLCVFAGAQQSGNRNSIQSINVEEATSWRNVPVTGIPPSSRTYHTNSSCAGDKLFVFSGGEAGAAPVNDPQLHVFDAGSSTWSQPETHGRAPSARHGHAVVTVGSKLYVHGGLSGDKFHSDMFSLDTQGTTEPHVHSANPAVTMTWERVRTRGDAPPAVASHSAVAVGKNIYVFGGMTPAGATNSMYRFHTDRQRWALMKFRGHLPPNRLDHSMCVVPWHLRAESSGGEKPAGTPKPDTVHLCFAFGGMDTQGVIHSDCVVTVLM
ncbi:rab9 effector protein with kelch motifs isoform X1 [Paramormyrops kingsleyae]|uniref:rab9 effector protein with kelch motifs isoform X1 n=1 Tax=Paramormyrops kingsleyae TaxID=1676925 RepID=UPI003B97AEED